MNANNTTLSPCTGRCSTVFGDSVCRGCRRFAHEVIEWNRYSMDLQAPIWQRLDQQLEQIIMPLTASFKVSDHYKDELDFLNHHQIKLHDNCRQGRIIYEVLRILARQSQPMPSENAQIPHDLLALSAAQARALLHTTERRVYALAVAIYELTWLRAATIQTESIE